MQDEILFLKKLLDLVLEVPTEEEKLFRSHYKDDINWNSDQILGLISAFNLLKASLVDIKELVKIEKERMTLLREISADLENHEVRTEQLSPRSRQASLAQLFTKFSQAIFRHSEFIDMSKGFLVPIETAKLKVSRLLEYKGYLEATHEQLKDNQRKLLTRLMESMESDRKQVMSGTLQFANSQQPPVQLSPPLKQDQPPSFGRPEEKAVQLPLTRQQPTDSSQLASDIRRSTKDQGQEDEEFIRNWDFERQFDPEDAFLLDQSLRLHEAAKRKMNENIDPKLRYDLSAVSMNTSLCRELNWPALQGLVKSYSQCFEKNSVKNDQFCIQFKDSCLKLKKLVENHLENLSRFDHSQASAKVCAGEAGRAVQQEQDRC